MIKKFHRLAGSRTVGGTIAMKFMKKLNQLTVHVVLDKYVDKTMIVVYASSMKNHV